MTPTPRTAASGTVSTVRYWWRWLDEELPGVIVVALFRLAMRIAAKVQP